MKQWKKNTWKPLLQALEWYLVSFMCGMMPVLFPLVGSYISDQVIFSFGDIISRGYILVLIMSIAILARRTSPEIKIKTEILQAFYWGKTFFAGAIFMAINVVPLESLKFNNTLNLTIVLFLLNVILCVGVKTFFFIEKERKKESFLQKNDEDFDKKLEINVIDKENLKINLEKLENLNLENENLKREIEKLKGNNHD